MRSTILATALLFAAPALAQTVVIDGDTIDHDGTRYRIHGIDAPEGRQKCVDEHGQEWQCGLAASGLLASFVAGKTVRCEALDVDRWRRTIGRCYAGDHDIGRVMVRFGWAVAYRQYSTDYVRDEDLAQEEGRGMWRGEFEMPWDWRRNR